MLLLVVSETGLVYTFTTSKLQSLVTSSEGKQLIQECLNAPDKPYSSRNNSNTPDVTVPSSQNPSNNETYSTLSESKVCIQILIVSSKKKKRWGRTSKINCFIILERLFAIRP